MSDSLSGLSLTSARKILLVEDNHENRKLLSSYLVCAGYQVLELADGYTFLETLAHFQPNLVLLDLKLPGIDGYALLEQIQQEPNWLHLPVIVFSAFAFQTDRQRALSLGARRYLVKPVSLLSLKQAIDEELSCLNL